MSITMTKKCTRMRWMTMTDKIKAGSDEVRLNAADSIGRLLEEKEIGK